MSSPLAHDSTGPGSAEVSPASNAARKHMSVSIGERGHARPAPGTFQFVALARHGEVSVSRHRVQHAAQVAAAVPQVHHAVERSSAHAPSRDSLADFHYAARVHASRRWRTNRSFRILSTIAPLHMFGLSAHRAHPWGESAATYGCTRSTPPSLRTGLSDTERAPPLWPPIPCAGVRVHGVEALAQAVVPQECLRQWPSGQTVATNTVRRQDGPVCTRSWRPTRSLGSSAGRRAAAERSASTQPQHHASRHLSSLVCEWRVDLDVLAPHRQGRALPAHILRARTCRGGREQACSVAV